MGQIKEKIEVEASNQEEAVELAYKEFQETITQEFTREDLKVELVEEKKKLFGLLGSKKTYNVELNIADEANDGDFEVIVRDDGIFLRVEQPSNGGKEVAMDMIEEKIDKKRIVDVNYTAVSEALTVDCEEIKIAERRPELDKDAEVKVLVSEDEMIAKLTYTPPLGGTEYTADEVIAKVKEQGVTFGIKEEEFKQAFNPDEILEDIIIARGQKPTPSQDAEIRFEVDFDQRDSKVNIQEDGSADFYNLNRIINVEPGDLLATKIPGEKGEPGKTVTGKEIAPDPVLDKSLPVGENVKKTEDGLGIISDMEGQVVFTDEKVSVLDVHTVNGDVDLSTGNIEFNGNVIIKGNVSEGMEVKAEGNIEIHGSVYKADIISEGNVTVKKGFIGSSKGRIEAKGSVNVKFIENGAIKAEDGLIVKDAIMHSHIDSGKKIIVNKNKGLIVGGEVRAANEIDAKIIGSNLATTTEIFVGVTPDLRDEFRNIDSDFEETQRELDMVIKDITLLKKKRKEQGNLNEKKQQLLNQLTRKRFKLAGQLEETKAKRDKLVKKIEKSKEGTVRVKKEIFPGVSITIGSSMEKIEKSKSYVEFKVRDGEIVTSSYD